MGEVTTIGLDLAKHVFQVYGVDAEGATVLRKQLRRAQVLAFFSQLPRCLVGLEACATAHYWGRELGALGHEVRLMPAQYVKAYIKRNKHDAADGRRGATSRRRHSLASYRQLKGRHCLSACRLRRETHSRTPYPSAKPTIRAIAISKLVSPIRELEVTIKSRLTYGGLV
jgi:transposase